jgi:hypothetical protein
MIFAKRFFILPILILVCFAANAQRKAGKDTILFILTSQNQTVTSDSGRSSSYSFTVDLNSIFIGYIRMDSIPENIKTSKINVEVTIYSNCTVTIGTVTGNPKHEYLIRKTRDYFNSARIVFITPEGIVSTNCGSGNYKMILPITYRF